MTGGVWVASYVLLWITVMLLCVAVIALLRQIGVLHVRLRPLGVHHAGEGLEPGTPAPALPEATYDAPLTLVAFTSPDCRVCRELAPSITALDRQYRDVSVALVSYSPRTAGVFRAFNVVSTPYVIAVGEDGVVRGGGVANSLEQIEVLLSAARSGALPHE